MKKIILLAILCVITYSSYTIYKTNRRANHYSTYSSILENDAQSGDSVAQLALGNVYSEGNGLKKIVKKRFFGMKNLQKIKIVMQVAPLESYTVGGYA